jgi:hypothetical protein
MGGLKMKLEKVRQMFKDEWVLLEVLEEDEIGQPVEVEIIGHSKSRDEIYSVLRRTKVKHVATLFAGEIPKEGYAVAFHGVQI